MNEKIGSRAIKTYPSKNQRSYIISGMGQLLLSVKENKDTGTDLSTITTNIIPNTSLYLVFNRQQKLTHPTYYVV